MGILSRFENKMEDSIEGTADKASRSQVTSAQITKRVEKEMRREKIVGAGKQYAPMLYTVLISPTDDKVLSAFYPTLAGETETYLMAKAREKGYLMDGHPLVRFIADSQLKRGKFDVVAEMVSSNIIQRLREDEMRRYGLQPSSSQSDPAVQKAREAVVAPAEKSEIQPQMHPLHNLASTEQEQAEELARLKREADEKRRQIEELERQMALEQERLEQAKEVNRNRLHGTRDESHIRSRVDEWEADNTYMDSPQVNVIANKVGVNSADFYPSNPPDMSSLAEQYEPAEPSEPRRSAVVEVSMDVAPTPQPTSKPEPQPVFQNDQIYLAPSDEIHVAPEQARAISNVPSGEFHVYLYDEERDTAYTLTGAVQTIGRESSNDITVPDINISRMHAQIMRKPDGAWIVTDLGSTNGLYVNGQKVQSKLLRDADIITIGTSKLEFQNLD